MIEWMGGWVSECMGGWIFINELTYQVTVRMSG